MTVTATTLFDTISATLTLFHNYMDRVHSLLPAKTGEESILFEYETLWTTVVWPALQVAVLLYGLFFGIILPVSGRWLFLQSSGGNHNNNKADKLSHYRLAFTATNLVVNTLLTAIGFYLEADEGRQLGQVDAYHRLAGDFGSGGVGFLPAWQIGVQLWCFPIGIFMIQEDSVMLLHHVALVGTALLPCCFRVGFRWHVPFFFGYVNKGNIDGSYDRWLCLKGREMV